MAVPQSSRLFNKRKWADWAIPKQGKGDPWADHYRGGDGSPFDIATQDPTTFAGLKNEFGSLESELRGKALAALANVHTTCGGPPVGIAFEHTEKYNFTWYPTSDLFYLGNGQISVTVVATKTAVCKPDCYGQVVKVGENVSIKMSFKIRDHFRNPTEFGTDDPNATDLYGCTPYPIHADWDKEWPVTTK